MYKKFFTFSQYLFACVAAVVMVFGFYLNLISLAMSGNDKASWLNSGNKNMVTVAKSNSLVAGKSASMKGNVISADARPIMIKKYLEHYNSPLVPYSDLIFELSEQYGYEYYWIVAIAQQESNLCKKIPENSFNCWGYGIHSAGTLRFDSYDTSLRSYAEYLKREYFDKGYMTAEEIMQKYCPHSNGSWAYGVNKFINELQTGNF